MKQIFKAVYVTVKGEKIPCGLLVDKDTGDIIEMCCPNCNAEEVAHLKKQLQETGVLNEPLYNV